MRGINNSSITNSPNIKTGLLKTQDDMDTNQTENQTSLRTGFCILPYDISEDQWAFYYGFLWWVEGFGSVLIGSIGILLNLITIWVLLGSELAASFFNWLLIGLATFDVLFLLNGILEAFRNHLGSGNFHVYLFVMFLYPFRSFVMCCSIYTTVLLALERYNALVRPISHQRMRHGKQSVGQYLKQHWTRLLKYIGPIMILAAVFCVPKKLELKLVNKESCEFNQYSPNKTNRCTVNYEIALTGLRSDNAYNLWYLNITNLFITAIIPLISLAYLNVNIYLKFRQYLQRQPTLAKEGRRAMVQNGMNEQKAKKREKDMIQQTMILFSVVVLFGLFHILRIVLNIEEFASLEKRKRVKEQKDGCEWLQYWTIIASPISHLLLQLNSSLNFVIYCYFNKSFRDVVILWINAALTYMKLKRAQRNDMNLNEQSFHMIRTKHATLTTAAVTETKGRIDSKEDSDVDA